MTLSLADLLVLALATYSLAHFIVYEDAPFKLMARFRARYPLGGLMTCVRCCGFWCAVFWLLLWQTPAAPLAYPFAIIGGALMLAAFSGVQHFS